MDRIKRIVPWPRGATLAAPVIALLLETVVKPSGKAKQQQKKIRQRKFHKCSYPKFFRSPLPVSVKSLKQILLCKVGVECPHHLIVSPPLNLHS